MPSRSGSRGSVRFRSKSTSRRYGSNGVTNTKVHTATGNGNTRGFSRRVNKNRTGRELEEKSGRGYVPVNQTHRNNWPERAKQESACRIADNVHDEVTGKEKSLLGKLLNMLGCGGRHGGGGTRRRSRR